jgi:excisionase family DNA binding protein
MTGPVYTVAEAARRLKLHERTILRFIRDGKLKATRVGRGWRVQARDLLALAGEPEAAAPEAAARVTAVVDIPEVAPELAMRWASSVTGALNGRPQARGAMRAEVVFDPEARRLKILIVGDPGEVADLLSLVRLLGEQLRP